MVRRWDRWELCWRKCQQISRAVCKGSRTLPKPFVGLRPCWLSDCSPRFSGVWLGLCRWREARELCRRGESERPKPMFFGILVMHFLQGEDCLFTPKAHGIKDESLITHRFDALFPAQVEDPVTSCDQSDCILELMFGWQVVLRHARVWASLQGRGKMHFQISWCADISWFWMLFHVVSGIQSSRTIFDPSNTTPPRGLLCVLFREYILLPISYTFQTHKPNNNLRLDD